MELVSVRCFITQVGNYLLVGMRSLFTLILHMLCWKGPSELISEPGSVFHLSLRHMAADRKSLWNRLGALSVFSPLCPSSRSGEAELAALAAHCASVHGPSLQSRSGSPGVKNRARRG